VSSAEPPVLRLCQSACRRARQAPPDRYSGHKPKNLPAEYHDIIQCTIVMDDVLFLGVQIQHQAYVRRDGCW